jgi:hypothetical protein
MRKEAGNGPNLKSYLKLSLFQLEMNRKVWQSTKTMRAALKRSTQDGFSKQKIQYINIPF